MQANFTQQVNVRNVLCATLYQDCSSYFDLLKHCHQGQRFVSFLYPGKAQSIVPREAILQHIHEDLHIKSKRKRNEGSNQISLPQRDAGHNTSAKHESRIIVERLNNKCFNFSETYLTFSLTRSAKQKYIIQYITEQNFSS